MHVTYEFEGDISSPKHRSGKIAQGLTLLKMWPVLLRELTSLDIWNRLRLTNTQYDAELFGKREPTLLVE